MNKKEFVVNPNDPFFIAIRTVFENWTALKLAISNEFAGSETKEIAQWFLNATYQWIVETGDLDDDELEPFFYNTMHNEFNTVIEDNSCLQIARLLIRFYSLYRENRLQELHDELMKRYSLAQGSIQASQKCKTEQDTSSEESADEEGDVEMADDDKPKNLMTEEEAQTFEQLDEGWTFVTKTGKKLTK